MIRKDIIKICKDFTKIENYSQAVLDTSQTWECHHRLETHYLKNGKWIEREVEVSREELKEDNLYFDRPASELIFMTKTEHISMHNRNRYDKDTFTTKGMCFSEETKTKISVAHKGKRHSDEAKEKMSEKRKNNYFWFNNGTINKRAAECPEGFVPGRLPKRLGS